VPELPEAESARRMLQRLLKGRRIASAFVRPDPIVFAGAPAARVAKAIAGRTVRAARRKGKHMWLELDRRPWPAFHFGMSGWFEVYRDSDERPAFWKLELLAGGRRIAFCDIRRLGRIRLQQDPPHQPPISELGFDPLEGLPDTAELMRHLARRSAPIKAVLLDQSLFAGVGNWIADEVLFQAGISPHRPARDLDRAEVARLRRVMHAIVAHAVKVDGDSARFPKRWLFHHRWDHRGEPRTADGSSIVRETIGGRTAAWVPARQR
jgi:formamidopyrimidine-DNA glycosylase